jgi:hypothetical protein
MKKAKNKTKATVTLFLLLLATIMRGQNLPTIVPPSPQAIQYNRYGEIPVGHTTGVPQIDIPIYTLSTGWIDIPVSISYHASGFRPREIPSPVGLGWVLNAGGIISRSVEMNPDYEDYNPNHNWDTEMPLKSAADIQSLKNGTKTFGTLSFHNYQNWDDWEPFFFTSYTPHFDTRSDRYYYSYLGNNGVVRYNVDTKELTAIPYDPVKIEKTGNTFLITDTKGIKYEFTQTGSVSVPRKGAYISGWYLTKITCPGKESDPIVFSYQNGTSYYDYYSSYSQLTQIVDTRTCNIRNGPTIGAPDAGSYTTTISNNIQYSDPLISTIKWKNTTVSFTYVNNRQDQRKDRITSITVKYGNSVIKQATFDNNFYFGNTTNNYRLKLKEVTIKGSNTTGEGDKYTFNYYNENAMLPNYEFKCHDDYWGYYNGTNSDWSFPNDININQVTGNAFVDAWFDHSVYSTDRKPNEATKTCVLNEIIYPTKGKSIFEYELNQVDNAYEFMNFNKVGGLRLKQRTNYSDTTTIADIKTYIYEGYPTQVLKKDLFVYRMDCIDSYYFLYAIDPNRYAPEKLEYPVYFFVGMPMSSLSGWAGSNVFYKKVKEYNETVSNTNEGWIEYNYEEESRSLNNECSWNIDEYPPYMYSKYVDCDKGYLKGLLKEVISYNKNGDSIKKVENHYQLFSIPPIHTGVRVFQNAIYGSGATRNPADQKSFYTRIEYYDNFGNVNVTGLKQAEYENFYLNRIYATDTYAFCDVSLPGTTIETEYVNGQSAVNKTTTYSYDTKDGKPLLFTASKVTSQNSRNETFTNTTVFPYNDNYKNVTPYSTMVTKNMLEYPVEVKAEKGTNQFISKIFTTYKSVSNMILPDIISTKYREGNTAEARITYHTYDFYGNPVYLSKDDATKVFYVWSYKGQYPIAEIQMGNYTFAQVEAVVKSVFSVTSLDALSQQVPNEIKLQDGSLQDALPGALVTTYIYKPLIGLWKIQDSRKVVTEYVYDDFGRLARTLVDGKAEKEYQYHYKN